MSLWGLPFPHSSAWPSQLTCGMLVTLWPLLPAGWGTTQRSLPLLLPASAGSMEHTRGAKPSLCLSIPVHTQNTCPILPLNRFLLCGLLPFPGEAREPWGFRPFVLVVTKAEAVVSRGGWEPPSKWGVIFYHRYSLEFPVRGGNGNQTNFHYYY